MPTHFIPSVQRQKARQLLRLSWHFSTISPGTRSIRHYDALAEHIGAEIECNIVGKSIQNLDKDLDSCTLTGFKRNTTKETLAGFVLYKAGLIAEVEVQKDHSGKGINHPVHKYWVLFESELERLIPHLPEDDEAETVSEVSEKPAYCLEPVLGYYEDTYWYLYSCSRNGAIYRHVMWIKKEKDGALNRVLIKNASSQCEDYVGLIGMDNGLGYMIANLMTQYSHQKHLHLKLRVSRGVQPRFAMGQSNFISSVNNRIMDAPNLLERTTEAAQPICLFPGEPGYRELPLAVRRYFYWSERIEMPSPPFEIVKFEQFKEWMDDWHKSRIPEVFSWCHHEYDVYYRNAGGQMERRSLRIVFDQNLEEPYAEFDTDYREKCIRANLFRHENRISLFASEHKGHENAVFYLNIQVPLQMQAPQHWLFPAHICGGWQGLYGDCARALVINKEQQDYDERAGAWVNSFFSG